MKLTRRELAAMVSATAMAAPQAEKRDELQIARERLKTNSDLLTQQQLPMATEPAFQFKA